MALVATIVVGAAAIAERSRPAMAALIATLPISVGPTYVMLALDHDAGFIAAAALTSMASVGASLVFNIAYAHAMLRFGPFVSLALGYVAWAPGAWFVATHDWSVAQALAFTGVAAAACHLALRPLMQIQPTLRPIRRWWDVPLRAACVVVLVGGITVLSTALGARGSGTLANFPVVMSSVSLITQMRLGGPTAAAMLAHATSGLLGVSLALLAVHFAIPAIGVGLALLAGLIFCILWNLGIFLRCR